MITGENDDRVVALTAFLQRFNHLAGHGIHITDRRIISANQFLLLRNVHLQAFRGSSVARILGNVIPVAWYFFRQDMFAVRLVGWEVSPGRDKGDVWTHKTDTKEKRFVLVLLNQFDSLAGGFSVGMHEVISVRFHDYEATYAAFSQPNVVIFREQIGVFKKMLEKSPPGQSQANDVDFLLAVGELFTLVVYGQLLLENTRIYAVEDDLVDQIFDVFVRDFSRFALELHGKPSSTAVQMEHCLAMIAKPATDSDRYARVWDEQVLPLRDRYAMNP